MGCDVALGKGQYGGIGLGAAGTAGIAGNPAAASGYGSL